MSRAFNEQTHTAFMLHDLAAECWKDAERVLEGHLERAMLLALPIKPEEALQRADRASGLACEASKIAAPNAQAFNATVAALTAGALRQPREAYQAHKRAVEAYQRELTQAQEVDDALTNLVRLGLVEIEKCGRVVDALLDRLNWPACGGSLFDPGAGDGSFLVQALRRLPSFGPEQLQRVRGWEIHPEAVREARQRVYDIIKPELGHNLALIMSTQLVEQRDFLTDGQQVRGFNLIAGNPPYLRYQNLPDYFKDVYAEALPKYARGDLLHAFLDLCVKILPTNGNGQIGFVCSDRFLFNMNAAVLRETIGKQVGISHLARLDAATSFYRPKKRRKGTPPRIHPVEVIMQSGGAIALSERPISPDFQVEDHSDRPTLESIAKVSIAPWLGPMGIFVLPAGELLDKLRNETPVIPAVDTDDIQADETLGQPTRWALNVKALPTGALDTHLRACRNRMPKRGLRRPYWLPPESITLDLSKPSLLIPRIARQLRAIPLPAGVLPINHNLSVVSTTGLAIEELREVLLSNVCQDWIQRCAPRLENGFLSITTSLLRRMPI